MKGIKAILGIALATTGLGGAIAVGAVSAEANKVEQAEAAGTISSVTLKGSFDNWESGIAFTKDGSGDYNLTRSMSNGVEFKIFVQGGGDQWVGYNWGISASNIDYDCIGSSGQNFKMTSTESLVFKVKSTFYTNYGSDVTIHKQQSFTVTKYAVLDGVKDSTALGSDAVVAGEQYDVPASPSKVGYTFNGWFTNEACTDSYTKRAINANLNIYAKFTSDSYSLSVNSGSYTNLVKNPGNDKEYCLSSNRSFSAGDTLAFKKNSTAKTPTLSSGDEYNINNATLVGGVITVTKAVASGNLYWNVDSNTLWVTGNTAEDGAVYLKGSFNNWQGFETRGSTSDNINYTFSNLNLAANAKMKAFVYDIDGNPYKESWIAPNSVSCDHSAEFPVSIDTSDNNNVKVTNAGHYDLTVNKNTGAYSFVAKDYIDPSVRYTVKIGSASPVPISLKSGSEYQTAEMDLTKGATVAVYNNGAADNTFNLKPIGNNNVNSSKEILFTKHDRIYVDVSAKTIFVGGLPYGGYHMVVNDDFVQMTENMDPLDPSYREFYSEVIDFNQNDIVKFIDTTSPSAIPTIFDITTINSSSISGFSVVGGSLKASKNIECSVFAKIKYGANEVYFGDVTEEVAKAREYAIAFSTAFNSICRESNQDETYVAALASEWSTQKTAFAALATKVQNVLKSATTSHNVQEIRAFISSYQYIAKKYNTRLGNDYNFLNKDLSLVIIESNRATTAANNNNNPLIIVVVSALTLVSATGLFFVIKRKKEVK